MACLMAEIIVYFPVAPAIGVRISDTKFEGRQAYLTWKSGATQSS